MASMILPFNLVKLDSKEFFAENGVGKWLSRINRLWDPLLLQGIKLL